MSRRHRYITSLLVSTVVLSALFGGCRPSQQARRGDTGRNGTSGASTRMMDSLLLVQEKLVTVIDTMSNILVAQQERIRTLESEVARLRSMLESQAIGGGGTLPRSAGYYTQPTPPVSAPPLSAPAPAGSENYSAALRLFNDGRYDEALAAFDALAHNEPTSPYAPNFVYWRGESLYALGRYDEAIENFQDVLQRFANSSKADDAQFKIGASYEKLNKTTSARSAYSALVSGYPESEYVSRARARLARLR